MAWFRRTSTRKPVEEESPQQAALAQQIRQQFGGAVRAPFRDQVNALVPMLSSDDGLVVAARVVRDVAEESYRGVIAQVSGPAVDRRNYRAVWRSLGPQLRSPLFSLSSGFFPYVHVTAAVTVIGGEARRVIRLVPPLPLMAQLLEILDLTTSGWEFGRVPVDPDAAELAHRLIATSSQLRAATKEEPPLPPPIRELMRRNNTTPVFDAHGRPVGGINLGGEMRPAFLT